MLAEIAIVPVLQIAGRHPSLRFTFHETIHRSLLFHNDRATSKRGLFRLFGETGSSMVPWSRSELAREKDAAKFPS